MNWTAPKVYATKHLDSQVIEASRSGGIFTALSDAIIEGGGVVFGCVLTDDFKAVHTRTEDKIGRDAMRGSKYIQSRLNDTFRMVKADLDIGRTVLFSGTSCQVKGLKNFLGREYEKLYCIDIVCHGVPSPLVWKKYLEWQESRAKAKVVSVNFRNKIDYGWRDHVETLTFNNGKKMNSRIFKKIFFGHHALRPSCYECPFKSIIHPGDITIADYWGIENAAPEFDDNKGVSLVLINNDKGAKIFKKVKYTLKWKETKIENSMQPALEVPSLKPDDRNQFWKDFKSHRFNYIAKKYAEFGFINDNKKLIKRLLRFIKRSLSGKK